MKLLNNVFDRLVQIFEWITIVVLAFMVALVFFNACLRYFFNTNIMATEELARFSFIWMCLLGSVVSYKRKNHIVITIFTDNLKGTIKKVVNCCARIITTLAIIFLCYGAVLYIQSTSQYMNAGIRINYGLVMLVLPIMSFSMLFLDVMDFIRLIRPESHAE